MLKTLKNIILDMEDLVKVFFLLPLKKFLLKKTCAEGRFFQVPIYIISFNRLNFLRQTVEWLKKYGYENINIIDNKSDYQPLLDYYKTCDCNVIYMKKNYGHLVFEKHLRFFFVRNFSFFVLTDPDLTPVEDCPNNFVEVFLNVFKRNPSFTKVGFSLKIDDLPDTYYLKDEVIQWESKFYNKKLGDEPVDYFDANIDTTFAVNSPKIFTSYRNRYRGIRIAYPYQVRHLPWYGEKKSDEILHYQETLRKDVSNWNGNISKERMQKRIKKHM